MFSLVSLHSFWPVSSAEPHIPITFSFRYTTLFCDRAFTYVTIGWKAFPSSSGKLLPFSQTHVPTLSLSESCWPQQSEYCSLHNLDTLAHKAQLCLDPIDFSIVYTTYLCLVPSQSLLHPPQGKIAHREDCFSVPTTGQASYQEGFLLKCFSPYSSLLITPQPG